MAENFEVNFEGNKNINLSVNLGEEGLQAGVSFPQGGSGSGECSSGLLEEFFEVVPDDSEEIISEEDIHAAVEDIWNTTFN